MSFAEGADCPKIDNGKIKKNATIFRMEKKL